MKAELKFEPSSRNGIIPIGTYLIDAAARFGITIEDDCGRLGECDSCAVQIISGAEFLSQPTKGELEHLNTKRRNNGERLSCQAKIESVGEICVMIAEKQKPEESLFETFKKEFGKLPLDEKIAHLLELEKMALGDTFGEIMNLPYTIGEKIRDGIAEFGYKMEEADKEATRPAEHREESSAKTEEKGEVVETKGTKAKVTKPKAAATKKAAPAKKKPAATKAKPETKTSSE